MYNKRKHIRHNIEQNMLKRYRAERRFRYCSVAAVIISCLFLSVLLFSLVAKGTSAFYQTRLLLPVHFDSALIDPTQQRDMEHIKQASFDQVIRESLLRLFPEAQSRKERLYLYQLVSPLASLEIRDAVIENPSLIGSTQQLWLLASSDVDMFRKGQISRDTPQQRRKLKDQQIAWLSILNGQNAVGFHFNRYFFSSGDSRQPEIAGILGGIVGSFFLVLVAMCVAFPIGVFSAIYLEEFAPKNRFTDFIEININNLAAVPSIVFGLLGLAIYIHYFGMPRSAALVGGLTLALMALPIIVIATRTAIRTVSPSIREAASALGASRMQTTLHHVLPLALPAIITGSILSVARIMGETAPLLMIGMVAFIVDVPTTIFDPATAMPVQIYLWADNPERGFAEKTAAAILVLLLLLAVINAIAAIIRNKFQQRW